MDSIPTVFITANVGNHLIGRDAFQEVCITGVTFPITKHNYFVNNKEDLADALRNAFRIANSGRKGPVLVRLIRTLQNLGLSLVVCLPFAKALCGMGNA